jgi:hypothetical protein
MSWRTNSLALNLPNMGRWFGLNSFLMPFVSSNSYEDKFNKALLSRVKKSDVTWDIGANIGYYTKLFAYLTGSQGKVFAFELNPQNYKRLASNFKDIVNVSLFPFGLVELPNFVKIDVEGFELEVINGMKKILVRQELKVLGIEVHFGLLTARGMADAPQKIETILGSASFSCSWPDSSHIIAIRIK